MLRGLSKAATGWDENPVKNRHLSPVPQIECALLLSCLNSPTMLFFAGLWADWWNSGEIWAGSPEQRHDRVIASDANWVPDGWVPWEPSLWIEQGAQAVAHPSLATRDTQLRNYDILFCVQCNLLGHQIAAGFDVLVVLCFVWDASYLSPHPLSFTFLLECINLLCDNVEPLNILVENSMMIHCLEFERVHCISLPGIERVALHCISKHKQTIRFWERVKVVIYIAANSGQVR